GLRDSVQPRGLARRRFSIETGGVVTLGFVLNQTRKKKPRSTHHPTRRKTVRRPTSLGEGGF
ncbi:hypothetical protein, partial [Cloacibacillus evryensis]|uniref:hypothetical protein n=1 Tax=Cloacibacillus evryensis TaxID=508460 RepID=UPI003A872896